MNQALSIAAAVLTPRPSIVLAALLCALLSGTASAQTLLFGQTATARLVEFDLPQTFGTGDNTGLDLSPGAIVVDTRGEDDNRVWFVTHTGVPPRVFRLDPPRSLMGGSARWTSWSLNDESLFTGGLRKGERKLRPSRDRRFIFVRTVFLLQRVDTQKCSFPSSQPCGDRTEWLDQPVNDTRSVSDVAVDDYNNVYTTATPTDPASSYVQRVSGGTLFNPTTSTTVTVKRWFVMGGAGICVGRSSFNDPCVAGVAVEPYGKLVFYSESDANNIGELNTGTDQVRRWSLNGLQTVTNSTVTPVREPRQLILDRYNIVWVVTGSGHLVRIDTRKSTQNVTVHEIPGGGLNDAFGIAPDDDVIGYTSEATANNESKVGMMFPNARPVTVTPTVPQGVPTATPDVTVNVAPAAVFSDLVCGQRKLVDARIRQQPSGDLFVDAIINSRGNDSSVPMGITANRSKSQGTFFYAVGNNLSAANRIGFARLPLPKKIRNPRDDDDDDDGSNSFEGRCCTTNDDDSDGIENDKDHVTAKENVTPGNDAILQPGQTASYSLTASATTLALIATATADDPLAQVGVEIYNSAGVLVASAPSTPGAAAATLLAPAPGTYTARVKNWGATPFTHAPAMIVRQPWP